LVRDRFQSSLGRRAPASFCLHETIALGAS
jgi:hypothetical protein